MKKIFFYIAITLATSIAFISCHKDDEGGSFLTQPAEITLNGAETIYVVQGLSYSEEGVNVTGGELYATVGQVATNRPGKYTINYIAKNADGAYSSVSRTVIVLELGDGSLDISGTYRGYRGESYGTDISITKIATGVFSVTDVFGGFYEYFREYGSAYRVPVIFRYEGNNKITMPVWGSSPWGELNFVGDTATIDSQGTIAYKVLFDDGTSIATEFKLEKK